MPARTPKLERCFCEEECLLVSPRGVLHAPADLRAHLLRIRLERERTGPTPSPSPIHDDIDAICAELFLTTVCDPPLDIHNQPSPLRASRDALQQSPPNPAPDRHAQPESYLSDIIEGVERLSIVTNAGSSLPPLTSERPNSSAAKAPQSAAKAPQFPNRKRPHRADKRAAALLENMRIKILRASERLSVVSSETIFATEADVREIGDALRQVKRRSEHVDILREEVTSSLNHLDNRVRELRESIPNNGRESVTFDSGEPYLLQRRLMYVNHDNQDTITSFRSMTVHPPLKSQSS